MQKFRTTGARREFSTSTAATRNHTPRTRSHNLHPTSSAEDWPHSACLQASKTTMPRPLVRRGSCRRKSGSSRRSRGANIGVSDWARGIIHPTAAEKRRASIARYAFAKWPTRVNPCSQLCGTVCEPGARKRPELRLSRRAVIRLIRRRHRDDLEHDLGRCNGTGDGDRNRVSACS